MAGNAESAAALKDVPLFASCDDEELTKIAELVQETDVAQGGELLREGEPGTGLTVIVDGTAEVRIGDEVVRVLGAGDFVGEIAMVTKGEHTASVVATSPVKALVMSHVALNRIQNDAPSVRAKIERKASERSRGNEATGTPE